jgi:hypothetical protein
MSTGECRCGSGRLPYLASDFWARFVGVDKAGGRLADVSVWHCKSCHQAWLHYFYEIEAFTGSGRWYMVALSDEEANSATADNAANLLFGKPWHIRGGSHFGTSGGRCAFPVQILS